MPKTEIEKKANKEIKKLRAALKNSQVLDEKAKILETIIVNTAWMKVKLDEVISSLKTAEIVIEYDNGGGQTGMRENPLFKGYYALFRSYMNGMTTLLSCMSEEEAKALEPDVEKPKTVLDIVREKHGKVVS